MSTEPLLLLFADSGLVTFICHGCGILETRNCATDKKFKSFTKERVSKEGECKKCNSKLNLFKNPHGQQYWINVEND